MHTIRLLHVIVETKVDFLKRDKKATTRNAMEAGARDSYWQTAALKFCDKDFNPSLLNPRDDLYEDFVRAKLNPAWTAYKADAKKLKEEFREVRKPLSLAMAKFKQSGMGEIPEAEKHRVAYTQYKGSKFKDFTGGNDILLYAYALLIQQQEGLLESSTTAMPHGSGHSSSGPAASRKCAARVAPRRVSMGATGGV